MWCTSLPVIPSMLTNLVMAFITLDFCIVKSVCSIQYSVHVLMSLL